ncbi:hypothetical protein [Litchfieldella rifensis]|uniref:Uncharacterized protein n=1 Tax=Litchfieldella rifensis TaxID=762643 RepID=A0ABV7LT81_9GAMM
MDSSPLIAEYRRWLVFQRQEQLSQEHRGAATRLAQAGAVAARVTDAYRSMADKGAQEGACYRTLFLRQRESGDVLPCEGWLFVRRVLAEGGMTRVRASLIETFTLEEGVIAPGERPAKKITLEIFDELLVEKSMATSCRVDRIDQSGDTRFITLLDAVRGDLRQHMK